MRSLLNKISHGIANQGQLAEQQAFDFLSNKGLIAVTRNFRCARGEIDLIMTDGEMLVFIEVRYRKQGSHGSALESVNMHKIKKLRMAAQAYLQKNRAYADYPCRFDVLGWQDGHAHWIKNAFY